MLKDVFVQNTVVAVKINTPHLHCIKYKVQTLHSTTVLQQLELELPVEHYIPIKPYTCKKYTA